VALRLVFFGRQGAGKGTQAKKLCEHYGAPHISTGDMLRDAVAEGTDFGRKAKEYIESGQLLPDDIMLGVIEDRLHKADVLDHGFLLDGFPRTVGQAEALAQITAARPLDVVVDLHVAKEVVLERLASRRVCSDCAANYSVDKPPKYGWVCDNCGGDVVQREDDTPAAIAKRLAEYEANTAPLIAWYKERGLLEVVDGIGAADDVTERLYAAIDERRT
jgi:adenylate kinase